MGVLLGRKVVNFEHHTMTASRSISRRKKDGLAMSCKGCQSDKPRVFNGEIAIHFPGLERSQQIHRMGLSEARGLLALRLRGIRRA
jgi:hypothetical protein